MHNPASQDLSASIQDYLKTIYSQTRSGQPTNTVALADALNIRPASVTNMLQKLAETQPRLVSYRKHHGVILTAEGEKAALQIIRRHRLIELFLFQVLNYPLDKIHVEAEELEHAVSQFFIERIAFHLHNPKFDPHGDPIPDCDLNVTDLRTLIRLSDLCPGKKGIVRQITNQNPDLLVYFKSIGLALGAELKVLHQNPIDGTQQIEILNTDQTQVFGTNISENVLLEVRQP